MQNVYMTRMTCRTTAELLVEIGTKGIVNCWEIQSPEEYFKGIPELLFLEICGNLLNYLQGSISSGQVFTQLPGKPRRLVRNFLFSTVRIPNITVSNAKHKEGETGFPEKMQAKDTAQSSSGKLHGLGHRLARPGLGCRPGEMVLFPMTHAAMSHPHAEAFWSINKHWVAGQQQTK